MMSRSILPLDSMSSIHALSEINDLLLKCCNCAEYRSHTAFVQRRQDSTRKHFDKSTPLFFDGCKQTPLMTILVRWTLLPLQVGLSRLLEQVEYAAIFCCVRALSYH